MSVLSIANSAQPTTAHKEAAEPRTVDPRAVAAYFENLATRDLQDFQQNWRDLAACRSFGAREWTFALYDIAKALPKHRQATQGVIRELRQFIHDNFYIWENGAKPHIRNADDKGIAISSWAMATLNQPASQDFMAKWQSRALTVAHNASDQGHSLPLWSLAVLDALNPEIDYSAQYTSLRKKLICTEFERQRVAKQIYDADLYFTGRSDIPNPYRLETNSPAEGRLASLFKKANFTVFKPKECLIPGFEKAIDFAVGKKKLIMPTEVDGHFHFWGTEDNQRLATELEYDSSSLFRSVLMTRLAPELRIARVDHNFLSRLLRIDSTKQKQVCSIIFNGIQTQAPGCYSVHADKPMLRNMVTTSGGVLIPQQA